MTPDETQALADLAAAAHDRTAPDGTAVVWHATLGDLSFGLVRQALLELLQTSPYWPRPADIRERARLVTIQRERDERTRRQLAARERHALAAATTVPEARRRTGPNMVRHVLGRLADAGQDVAAGKLLGRDRAVAVAEAAVHEWLDRTEPAYTEEPR